MTTERHHHLTNPRPGPHTIPDGTAEPVCSQCGIALHLVPLEGIRTGTATWCSDACYKRFIVTKAWRMVAEHVASDDYQPDPAHEIRVSHPVPQNAARAVPKSAARKTGEVAANVVGFVVWLTIVSAIAAAVFAACGINTMR